MRAASYSPPSTRKLVKTSTPGVYKRGSRYVVVYRDPSGRQRKQAARTLAEARALKSTLTADVVRGEFRVLSRVRFGEYAVDWLATYTGRTSRGLGDGTREDYALALGLDPKTGGPLEPWRGAVAFFGRLRLAEVEPRDVKRYMAELAAQGLAPSSVAKGLAPVRALFATAVEEGLVRSNPAAGVRIARRNGNEDADQAKALSDDELRKFLDKTGESRFFFEFLAQSGLRIGEAIELRYGDVNATWLKVARAFSRGRIGKPKGRKTRRVPLGEEMARRLWQRRKEAHASAEDLVFTSERGYRIIPSNLMSRVLKPAERSAGIGDWPGFHTFRHTCATMLFRNGWNAVQVQKFLGHSDPGFTLRTYVHLLPEDLPDPAFLAALTAPHGGNNLATRAAETGRDETALPAAVSPFRPDSRENPEAPRVAEKPPAHS